MASNSVTLDSDINQCSICLESFTQPKFLDCFHTFCMECIRDLNQTSPGTVCCPLCQRQVRLPAEGVEQLTSNFYIMNINTSNNCNCNCKCTSNNSITTNSITTDSITTNNIGNTDKNPNKDKKSNDDFKFRESNQINNIKTIDVDLGKEENVEFDGVTFRFDLRQFKSDKWGYTLGVQIQISEPSSPLVKSYDIDYDISLVNQKARECSVRETGSRNLVPGRYSDRIHLVKWADALNRNNCFYNQKVELSGLGDIIRQIFQLDVDIKVKNKTMKNFKLK